MYDLNEKYDAECKLTYSELEDDIYQGYEYAPSYNDFYQKFIKEENGGIIDRFRNNVGYDFEKIAGESQEEKFAMFQLLKAIFLIQNPVPPDSDDAPKIKITHYLLKPHMKNFDTNIDETKGKPVGRILTNLLNQLSDNLPDAEIIRERLDRVNDEWNQSIKQCLDYVVLDEAIEAPIIAQRQLNKIEALVDKIIGKLEGVDPSSYPTNDGVLRSFYSLLICHRYLCTDNEVDYIYSNLKLPPHPSESYIKYFEGFEKQVTTLECKQELKELNKKEPDPQKIIDLLCRYVIEASTIDKNLIKDYKFAFKHCKTLLEWWFKYGESVNHNKIETENGISFDSLVIAVQEIVFLCKSDRENKKNNKDNAAKIKNLFNGCKNKTESFLTALRKPATASEMIKRAWITRLEHRTCLNYGVIELLEKKRSIEKKAYKIKEKLFSYRSIDNLELASDLLLSFFNISLIDDCDAFDFCKQCVDDISKCAFKSGSIKYPLCFEVKHQNALNPFKIMMNDEKATNKFIRLIAHYINNHPLGFCFIPTIPFKDNVKYRISIRYKVDQNKIFFYQAAECKDDETIKRCKEIGLGKFISED